ncbi:MAG: 50S ribosomal protein L32 [Anaerolineae bacterium]|nr:50S ribosomal protein L32 [Anaerolineae bacterium]
MAPQPKRKLSKGRRDRRRAHDSLPAVHLVKCPKCGSLRQPHRLCLDCGTYKGVTYIAMKEEKK